MRPCNWIGGLDLNDNSIGGNGQDTRSPFVTVLVSMNKKMRVIRIGEGLGHKVWFSFTQFKIHD
jgi:hypothetical protein